MCLQLPPLITAAIKARPGLVKRGLASRAGESWAEATALQRGKLTAGRGWERKGGRHLHQRGGLHRLIATSSCTTGLSTGGPRRLLGTQGNTEAAALGLGKSPASSS